MSLGFREVWRLPACCDPAEEMESPGLVTATLLGGRELESPSGLIGRFHEASDGEIRLTQPYSFTCDFKQVTPGHSLLDRALEQRQSIINAPAQGICCTKSCHRLLANNRQIGGLGQPQTTFE